MKHLKSVLAVFVSVMFVFSEAYASIPEIPMVLGERPVSVTSKSSVTRGWMSQAKGLFSYTPMHIAPSGVVAQQVKNVMETINRLPSGNDEVVPAADVAGKVNIATVPGEQKIDEVLTGLGESAQLEELTENPTWTKRKLGLMGALLLLMGLTFGIVAVLASSSGSGSGSGSGPGSGPGGNQNNPNNPPNNDNPEDTDDEGEDTDTDETDPDPNTNDPVYYPPGTNDPGTDPIGRTIPLGVPNNPEPSTLLLAGLGLLIPLLRRKK